MLSHGTGSSAIQLAWLGTVLARHGYIAVAVNHPGNNALEPYTAEGSSSGGSGRRISAMHLDGLCSTLRLGRMWTHLALVQPGSQLVVIPCWNWRSEDNPGRLSRVMREGPKADSLRCARDEEHGRWRADAREGSHQ